MRMPSMAVSAPPPLRMWQASKEQPMKESTRDQAPQIVKHFGIHRTGNPERGILGPDDSKNFHRDLFWRCAR